MKQTECNYTRLEIDENELGAALSSRALQHLRECPDCQEFNTKQTKLRQIVGSLEMVSAPADFDFRLRARLASSDKASNYQFLSVRSPAFAVAVLVLVALGAFAFLRQFVPREQQLATNPPQSTEKTSAQVKEPVVPAQTGQEVQAHTESSSEQGVASATESPRRSAGPTPGHKRQPAVAEFSSTTAPLIRDGQPFARMAFPLDVAQESFTVSVDDGRGSSRTISLPSVSFGSRRVLAGRNVNQLTPNGAW